MGKNNLTDQIDQIDKCFVKSILVKTKSLLVGLERNFVEEEPLCGSTEKHVFPTKGKTLSGTMKYIVNTDKFKQIVSTHTCYHFIDKWATKSCKYGGLEGNYPEETECKQLYWNQELLAISSEGVIEFDTFPFPSVCACHILDYEWTISWFGS